MTIRTAIVCSVAAFTVAAASLFAHDITFKGTAIAAEKETVRVNVVDPETKKVTAMAFVVDDETKVLRDNVLIKYVNANIQKGEAISVTVNHDLDEELAQIIRLGKTK